MTVHNFGKECLVSFTLVFTIFSFMIIPLSRDIFVFYNMNNCTILQHGGSSQLSLCGRNNNTYSRDGHSIAIIKSLILLKNYHFSPWNNHFTYLWTNKLLSSEFSQSKYQ